MLHGHEKHVFSQYDTKKFKGNIEEQIPPELMAERLLPFAEGKVPNWGDTMKPWVECEKVKYCFLSKS